MSQIVAVSKEKMKHISKEQRKYRTKKNPLPGVMIPQQCCITCDNFITNPNEREFGCAKGYVFCSFFEYFNNCWEELK